MYRTHMSSLDVNVDISVHHNNVKMQILYTVRWVNQIAICGSPSLWQTNSLNNQAVIASVIKKTY